MDKKIPLTQNNPTNLQCTSCLLPMQYQSKIEDKFLWQCFKCGKKYLVLEKYGSYEIDETWSPPK